MTDTDLKTLAKYPFTPEAKEYVAKLNLTLDQIKKHPIYSEAIELAKKRLTDALQGEIKQTESRDKTTQELTILSYAIARTIAHSTKNRNIISKYAKSEAQYAYNQLRKEDEEKIEEIKKSIGLNTENMWIDFTEYLKLTKDMSDTRWALANRILDKGKVKLRNRSELLELLKEKIKEKIMEPMETKNMPEEIKAISKEFIEEKTKTTIKTELRDIDNRILPPCINNMLIKLESGAAAHKEMFILGTFFIGLGLKVDDVTRIFSKSPKFNEEKTRYQLSFIAGDKSTTKYSCPTCAKIKSYGLCTTECNIKHPINYYKQKKKIDKKIVNQSPQ